MKQIKLSKCEFWSRLRGVYKTDLNTDRSVLQREYYMVIGVIG